jgi:hypothetical protein
MNVCSGEERTARQLESRSNGHGSLILLAHVNSMSHQTHRFCTAPMMDRHDLSALGVQ